MKIHVDYHCQYVKFTSTMPTDLSTGDMWFGFGMGGEYDIVSSEEDEDADESAKMNGYALITRNGNVTFETSLVPGERPIPQTQQNLYDCSMTIDDGKQTTVCYRELFDGDDNDFDEFLPGDIQIAWAYGNIDDDGLIRYHFDNAEADDRDKIFLEGDIECISMDTSQIGGDEGTTQDKFAAGDDDDDDDNAVWMIIAIIFIVLCVILLVVSGIMYRKGQNNPPPSGYIHGNQVSTDGGAGTSGQTQLTEIDNDDGGGDTRQGDVVAADTVEKDTYNENDDLL